MIGTAGWSIPKAAAANFPDGGSHLERYAARMSAVEINSSFHRPHRRSTYERWAANTPEHFRFSIKLPKEITHTRKLVEIDEPLARFVEECGGLGRKLAVMLVQLPPKLVFYRAVAAAFFQGLRRSLPEDVEIACEPRHPSWFDDAAEACLVEHRVARVGADPVLAPGGERPGGWTGLRYRRLHGSPRVYSTPYERERLEGFASAIAAEPGGASWWMFDNTASGAATSDALTLQSLVTAP
jgi:uncharacterized protein YecE (DUF72 family)